METWWLCWGVTLLCGAAQGRELDVGQGHCFSRIQSAVDAALPGDEVVVYLGVYHEAVVVGTANLTIRGSDPNNPPVQEGADPNSPRGPWELVTSCLTSDGRMPIHKPAYRWPHEQPEGEDLMTYYGGVREQDTVMNVHENERLLRGYRNNLDVRYAGNFCEEHWYCQGGPCEDLSQFDPEMDPDNSQCQRRRNPNAIEGKVYPSGRFLYDEQAGELYVWSEDEDNPTNHEYAVPVIFHLVSVEGAEGFELSGFVLRHAMGYAVRVDQADNVRLHHNYFVANRYDVWLEDSSGCVIASNFFQEKGLLERHIYNDLKNFALWGYDIRTIRSNRTEVFHNLFHGSYQVLGAGYAGEGSQVHDNIVSFDLSAAIGGFGGNGTAIADWCVRHRRLFRPRLR